MTHIEGFPLPATAKHDEDGNHIPPFIPNWRRAADPRSLFYSPDRVALGWEVELNERRQAQFAAHLAEHRRLGEPAVVVEGV